MLLPDFGFVNATNLSYFIFAVVLSTNYGQWVAAVFTYAFRTPKPPAISNLKTVQSLSRHVHRMAPVHLLGGGFHFTPRREESLLLWPSTCQAWKQHTSTHTYTQVVLATRTGRCLNKKLPHIRSLPALSLLRIARIKIPDSSTISERYCLNICNTSHPMVLSPSYIRRRCRSHLTVINGLAVREF